LLARGQWFSPGTPASSTTKTGRHDIAEISLKVALKHQRSNQSIITKRYSTMVKISRVGKKHKMNKLVAFVILKMQR
jgi:hypothetical protein